MCGFLGSITTEKISEVAFKECNKRIECRGPDEKKFIINKYYESDKLFYNLAFNRLSIIDLSQEASQPMLSKKYRSLIMFNGEIFNHRELRNKLEKKKVKFFTSHSDTEVLLNGLSFYGMNFLNEINGQFAIFFVDSINNDFYLIRDRAGQKPLYYHINNKNLYFGSDLQSVKNLSQKNNINNRQIINYLNFGTSISPDSFYEDISTVQPGEYLKISTKNNRFIKNNKRYWNISSFIDDKKFNQDEFINLFEDSVEIRLESDVPISNFLSGGLDSTSIIKATSKKISNINTFSMITDSKSYNETEFMDKVVSKYKTNHKVEKISSKIKFSELKNILCMYDDIISDPSIIPTFILSNKISKYYKVAISGDGGDELLSGYDHYINFFKTKKIPSKLVNSIFNIYPSYLGTGNNFVKYSTDWKTAFASYYGDKQFMKLLGITSFNTFEDIYLEKKEKDWKSIGITDYEFFLNEMMLKKIDRSSMLNSLEIRSPFVDYRLFEYIMSHSNFNEGDIFTPKKIIKNYLSSDFQNDFLERKKMGFSIDIKSVVNLNQNEIFESIYSSRLNKDFDLSKVNLLLKANTRINSIRIWKLFCLSLYLKH